MVRVRMEHQAGDISSDTGQTGGQQCARGTVTTHRQAKDGKTNGEVRHEVSQVKMKHGRGKKSPPCSVGDSGPVHGADRFQERSRNGVQPMKQGEQKAPRDGATVESDFRPRQFLPPEPAAIFQLILAQRCQRARVILRFNQQHPTVSGLFDDGLDALTDQHQAPIHRLPPVARRDDRIGGFRACHAKPILLGVCLNVCCFGLKICLCLPMAMSDWQQPGFLASFPEQRAFSSYELEPIML